MALNAEKCGGVFGRKIDTNDGAAHLRFNRYIWELYAGSAEGRNAIERYAHASSDLVDEDLRNLKYGCGANLDIADAICAVAETQSIRSPADAEQFFSSMLGDADFGFDVEHGDCTARHYFGDDCAHWFDYVAGVSVGLYRAHPEYFLPYLFRRRYNDLEELHAEFGIPLETPPGKGDEVGRALYYLEINESWQAFRHALGLSPNEMCAFLYDFGPRFLPPIDDLSLPCPTKAWLVSGGAGGDADFTFVNGAGPGTISSWATNANVRRGDILLMYLITPRCCIDSIWRAGTDGFIDPLFHYHSQAFICCPQRVAPITFAELKRHPTLSQMPAVKAHFQGPNGKSPFLYDEYAAILEILKGKGQDVAALPQLPVPDEMPDVELNNERDVEVELIEPFLRNCLGYVDGDWVRQLAVRMGRGERNYPDYAFGATTERGNQSAKMICESKFQLSAKRDLDEAFMQAHSYAKRLGCEHMMCAAKEGIWVFPRVHGTFDVDHVVYKAWGQLRHPDHSREVADMIGRAVVLRPTRAKRSRSG